MAEKSDSFKTADFIPDSYFQTADLARTWLGRLGGYDLKVNEELPKEGAAIITPKHTSMMDVPLLGVTSEEVYSRYIRFVGKKQLFEVPVVGRIIADYFYERGGISLDRQVRLANQPAKAEIEQALDEGDLVALFGEGTRRRDQAHDRGRKVGKIKKGLAALAISHNLPIQTVGVAGTRHWYGYKYVVYGRVIMPDKDKFDPENERSLLRYARELTKDVHQGMQEATDEAYRERSKTKVYIPHFSSRQE